MDAVKLLSSLLKNNSMGSNILGGLLGGGGSQQTQGGGGGLGALVGMLGGGGGGGSGQGGGAGGLLSSILGGGKSSGGGGGGLGALAGMLGGGAAAGGLLGKLMGGGDEAEAQPAAAIPQEANQEAELLIRAMCNAAKADGRLDDAEKQNIIGRLGEEVTQDEIDFVQGELSAPLDVDGFVRSVPQGAGPQVYSFSVMAIKIDEQSEANYLGQLAQGLGLDAAACNEIHDQLGAPKIFA
jgi:uncharacterized membrane protein YebE (DUF533 family)